MQLLKIGDHLVNPEQITAVKLERNGSAEPNRMVILLAGNESITVTDANETKRFIKWCSTDKNTTIAMKD